MKAYIPFYVVDSLIQMNNSIRQFLNKSKADVISHSVKCIIPQQVSLPTNLHPPTLAFNSYTNKFKNAQDFYDHIQPIPFQTNTLPKDRSEIRGVDSSIHRFLFNKFKWKEYPPILKNEFMMIQFFPHHHIISNFRKSNIAFAVNIYTIPLFNSIRLRDAMNRYRGRYSNLQFFKTKTLPIQSACGRSQTKKLFRELFVKALQTLGVINKEGNDNTSVTDKLKGVYAIHIYKVPITTEQKDKLVQDYSAMINKIVNDKNIWNTLNQAARRSKSVNLQPVLPNVRFSWEVGNCKDDRIRFPFINMTEIQSKKLEYTKRFKKNANKQRNQNQQDRIK